MDADHLVLPHRLSLEEQLWIGLLRARVVHGTVGARIDDGVDAPAVGKRDVDDGNVGFAVQELEGEFLHRRESFVVIVHYTFKVPYCYRTGYAAQQ